MTLNNSGLPVTPEVQSEPALAEVTAVAAGTGTIEQEVAALFGQKPESDVLHTEAQEVASVQEIMSTLTEPDIATVGWAMDNVAKDSPDYNPSYLLCMRAHMAGLRNHTALDVPAFKDVLSGVKVLFPQLENADWDTIKKRCKMWLKQGFDSSWGKQPRIEHKSERPGSYVDPSFKGTYNAD